MWPVFLVCTVADGVLAHELPISGEGTGFLPGTLFSACLNLALIAVVAPIASRLLRRRRRPDLPRVVADDYAGVALLAAGTAVLLVGGLLHRPAVAAQERAARAQAAAARDYLVTAAPARVHARLDEADTLKLADGLYRTCVPDRRRRAFCVFVRTTQDPAIVREDLDRTPNARYSRAGGWPGP